MIHEFLSKIIEWDKKTFLYLNGLGEEQYDWFWLVITEMKNWIPLYIIFLFLLLKQTSFSNIKKIVFLVILLIVISDQTVNLFKYSFDRLRPCYNTEIQNLLRLVKDNCGGKYGFVSAHASNHFAIAIFLGNIFSRKYKTSFFLLLIWATFIAYSRIYIGVHFPIDVIGGAILGTFYGYIFYLIYTKFED